MTSQTQKLISLKWQQNFDIFEGLSMKGSCKSLLNTLIQKALESLQLVKNNPSQTVQNIWP